MTSPCFRHRAFGLTIQSTRAIPGLRAQPDGGEPDLLVEFHEASARATAGASERLVYERVEEPENNRLRVWANRDDGSHRLAYADGIGFRLDAQGRQLSVFCPDAESIPDAAVYLLGSIFTLILRLRGGVCLHGSSVAGRAGAIAFLGRGGDGKSTIAAALNRRGYRLLHDDIVALRRSESRFMVQPGPQIIKLWPDSVGEVYGPGAAIPELPEPHPSWDKRHVDLHTTATPELDPQPLSVIYVAGARGVPLALVPLPPGEAVPALLATVQPHYVKSARIKRREFECLSSLATTLPVRRIDATPGLQHLDSICELIQEDEARLRREALAPSVP